MSSSFRIDYVEAALIGLLAASLPTAYGSQVQVDSLGAKDFDEDGRLTLQPPAVRVLYSGGQYENLRDNKRLTYQAGESFEVLCYQSSLRSRADQRLQTLQLVAVVMDQLAGARLALQDGTSSLPVSLQSCDLVVTDEEEVAQFYTVKVLVEGIAQFSGANA